MKPMRSVLGFLGLFSTVSLVATGQNDFQARFAALDVLGPARLFPAFNAAEQRHDYAVLVPIGDPWFSSSGSEYSFEITWQRASAGGSVTIAGVTHSTDMTSGDPLVYTPGLIGGGNFADVDHTLVFSSSVPTGESFEYTFYVQFERAPRAGQDCEALGSTWEPYSSAGKCGSQRPRSTDTCPSNERFVDAATFCATAGAYLCTAADGYAGVGVSNPADGCSLTSAESWTRDRHGCNSNQRIATDFSSAGAPKNPRCIGITSSRRARCCAFAARPASPFLCSEALMDANVAANALYDDGAIYDGSFLSLAATSSCLQRSIQQQEPTTTNSDSSLALPWVEVGLVFQLLGDHGATLCFARAPALAGSDCAVELVIGNDQDDIVVTSLRAGVGAASVELARASERVVLSDVRGESKSFYVYLSAPTASSPIAFSFGPLANPSAMPAARPTAPLLSHTDTTSGLTFDSLYAVGVGKRAGVSGSPHDWTDLMVVDTLQLPLQQRAIPTPCAASLSGTVFEISGSGHEDSFFPWTHTSDSHGVALCMQRQRFDPTPATCELTGVAWLFTLDADLDAYFCFSAHALPTSVTSKADVQNGGQSTCRTRVIIDGWGATKSALYVDGTTVNELTYSAGNQLLGDAPTQFYFLITQDEQNPALSRYVFGSGSDPSNVATRLLTSPALATNLQGDGTDLDFRGLSLSRYRSGDTHTWSDFAVTAVCKPPTPSPTPSPTPIPTPSPTPSPTPTPTTTPVIPTTTTPQQPTTSDAAATTTPATQAQTTPPSSASSAAAVVSTTVGGVAASSTTASATSTDAPALTTTAPSVSGGATTNAAGSTAAPPVSSSAVVPVSSSAAASETTSVAPVEATSSSAAASSSAPAVQTTPVAPTTTPGPRRFSGSFVIASLACDPLPSVGTLDAIEAAIAFAVENSTAYAVLGVESTASCAPASLLLAEDSGSQIAFDALFAPSEPASLGSDLAARFQDPASSTRQALAARLVALGYTTGVSGVVIVTPPPEVSENPTTKDGTGGGDSVKITEPPAGSEDGGTIPIIAGAAAGVVLLVVIVALVVRSRSKKSGKSASSSQRPLKLHGTKSGRSTLSVVTDPGTGATPTRLREMSNAPTAGALASAAPDTKYGAVAHIVEVQDMNPVVEECTGAVAISSANLSYGTVEEHPHQLEGSMAGRGVPPRGPPPPAAGAAAVPTPGGSFNLGDIHVEGDYGAVVVSEGFVHGGGGSA